MLSLFLSVCLSPRGPPKNPEFRLTLGRDLTPQALPAQLLPLLGTLSALLHCFCFLEGDLYGLHLPHPGPLAAGWAQQKEMCWLEMKGPKRRERELWVFIPLGHGLEEATFIHKIQFL